MISASTTEALASCLWAIGPRLDPNEATGAFSFPVQDPRLAAGAFLRGLESLAAATAWRYGRGPNDDQKYAPIVRIEPEYHVLQIDLKTRTVMTSAYVLYISVCLGHGIVAGASLYVPARRVDLGAVCFLTCVVTWCGEPLAFFS